MPEIAFNPATIALPPGKKEAPIVSIGLDSAFSMFDNGGIYCVEYVPGTPPTTH